MEDIKAQTISKWDGKIVGSQGHAALVFNYFYATMLHNSLEGPEK